MSLSTLRSSPSIARFGPGLERLRLRLSRWRSAPLLAFWLLVVAILVLPIALFLLSAFSPRLLGQGDQWFTLSAFGTALRGPLLRGLLDSLGVGVASAVLASVVAGALSWLVLRTDVPGRGIWSGAMFVLLLAPSYLIALGWERLLEPGGLLDLVGLPPGGLRGLFFGPVGIVVVLTVKGVPFAYLALSNALRGLGEEFEMAVRVHGGGRLAVGRVVVALLGPAAWSALAIVFAESVSDFGVAATLARDSHFPVATYTLYSAVDSFPVRFSVAAAVGWMLLGMAGLALLAQSAALRGRSFRVLGGRSRPARRHHLSPKGRVLAVSGLLAVTLVGLGVPAFGAVSASLVSGLGSLAGSHGLTLDNYQRVLHSDALRGPLLYSAQLALVTATATVLLAVVTARLLAHRGARLSARALDLVLLTAVALPGIVFAAGYIFTYNLPVTNRLDVHLYQTSTLLVLGYLATALPSTSRVLLGSVSQVQESVWQAGRVHGAGASASWFATVLPLLARPLIGAWLLTFAGTLLELPVSQLLYPPDQPPVSVGITKALANYDFGGGTAMEVIAVGVALLAVALAWGIFHGLAPVGWRRWGRTT